MGFEETRRGDEVLLDFGPLHGTLHAAPLVVVAWIATQGVKRVWGKGDESGLGQAAGDVRLEPGLFSVIPESISTGLFAPVTAPMSSPFRLTSARDPDPDAC